MKIGIIDIGSNTSKLSVFQKGSSDSLCIVHQESLPGRMIFQTQESVCSLTAESIEKVFQSVQILHDSARRFDLKNLIAVGTHGLRKADNAGRITDKVHKMGIPLHILSGKEEARYVSLALLCEPKILGLNDFVGIDIGGGSIEIIVFRSQKASSFESLPLGAVELTNRFFSKPRNPIPQNECNKLKNFVRETLSKSLNSMDLSNKAIVGTGGALVFVQKTIAEAKGISLKEKGIIHLHDLLNLQEQMAKLPISKRIKEFPQLDEERAEILLAGLLVVTELMNLTKLCSLIHSFRNLRYGLAREFFTYGKILNEKPNTKAVAGNH